MINLRHLRFAVVAAEHGSFRKAADLLSIRQSTLSRSICQLEHSIGNALFVRSSGGVRPTAIGGSILRIARALLEDFDNLIAAASSGESGDTGRLAVGFSTALSAGNLRATLLDFKKRFSKVEVLTTEKSGARLADLLRNGFVDILIIPGDRLIDDSQSVVLWSERILVALPDDHSLTAKEFVYWTDLRNETLLLGHHDPERELEHLLNSKLLLPADRPRLERHDVSRGTIKALVSMRMGISLVLESDLCANPKGPLYRELRDGTGPARLGFTAYWRPDNDNPALHSFLALLAERYPSLGSY
jgi:DNA-binding transcriptional LysR family regulator